MKELTSPIDRFINKYVIPILVLMVLVFTCIGIFLGRDINGWLIFALLITAISFSYLIKVQTYDLVDMVYDDDNALVFKKSGETVTVMLADIKNISFQAETQSVKVTLKKQTAFGHTICFALSNITCQTEFIDGLVERIERAKCEHL